MTDVPEESESLPRRQLTPAWEAKCEACGQEYVFFWEAAGVAPCPACGWIQKAMYPEAQAQHPARLFSLVVSLGAICLCAAAIFLIVAVQVQMERPQPVAEGQLSKQAIHWLIEAALVVIGTGLLLWAGYGIPAYDPNSESVEQRLARARLVSLPKNAYLKLLSQEPAAPASPHGPDMDAAPGVEVASDRGSGSSALLLPSDYRTYGWWYVVIGPILFIGGMASLLDPTAPRAYLGAAIVGPILFLRGLYYLRNS